MRRILFSFVFLALSLKGFTQLVVSTIDKKELGLATYPVIVGGGIIPVFIDYDLLSSHTKNNKFVVNKSNLFYKESYLLKQISHLESNDKPSYPVNHDSLTAFCLNKNHLPLSPSRCGVTMDSEHRKWLYTRDSSVFLFTENGFEHHNRKRGLKPIRVNDIVETPEGNIYAATARGLYLFNGERWERIKASLGGTKLKHIRGFAEQEDGSFMLYTKSRLFRLKEGVVTNITLPSSNIAYIIEDNVNNLWLQNIPDKVVYKASPDGKLHSYGFSGTKLHNAFSDSEGNAWLITFNKGYQLLSPAMDAESIDLPFYGIHSLYEDENAVWLQGSGGSLYRNKKDSSLTSLNSLCMVTDVRDNEINQVGMVVANVGQLSRFSFASSDLLIDKEGNKIYTQANIVCTTTGVAVAKVQTYNKISFLLYCTKEGDFYNLTGLLAGKDNFILKSYFDSDGNLWLDTPSQLHKIDYSPEKRVLETFQKL